MKRTKPTEREIAKQLIAEYHQKELAAQAQKTINDARAAEASCPRIGPKAPVYLPYKENDLCY